MRGIHRSFDGFFDLCLNKQLRKQSWGWWFETLSPPSWRHCSDVLAPHGAKPSTGYHGWHVFFHIIWQCLSNNLVVTKWRHSKWAMRSREISRHFIMTWWHGSISRVTWPFTGNSHNKHRIARLWGRDMFFLLQNSIHVWTYYHSAVCNMMVYLTTLQRYPTA